MDEQHIQPLALSIESVFTRVGLTRRSAEELALGVSRAIQQHGALDTEPIKFTELDVFASMSDVDDVNGMADALGDFATALINIGDALAEHSPILTFPYDTEEPSSGGWTTLASVPSRAGGGRKLAEWPEWHAALADDDVAAIDITQWCLANYETLLHARGSLDRGAKREHLRMLLRSGRVLLVDE